MASIGIRTLHDRVTKLSGTIAPRAEVIAAAPLHSLDKDPLAKAGLERGAQRAIRFRPDRVGSKCAVNESHNGTRLAVSHCLFLSKPGYAENFTNAECASVKKRPADCKANTAATAAAEALRGSPMPVRRRG